MAGLKKSISNCYLKNVSIGKDQIILPTASYNGVPM